MNDLISRQNALKALSWDTEAYMAINMMPTVDAVTVVRCKDCKHWDTDWQTIKGKHFCIMVERQTEGEFFCADGERKEE